MKSPLSVAELLIAICAVETWRQIEGWPYEVSSWGNVRRIGSHEHLEKAETHGYLHVSLSAQGQHRTARIHKLVARAFLGSPPFPEALAAHNDGQKHNNRADNVRWASALENQIDRERHDTKHVGSEIKAAKLTETDIPVIRRRIARRENYQDIADDFGVTPSAISLIKMNKTWRHVPPDVVPLEASQASSMEIA